MKTCPICEKEKEKFGRVFPPTTFMTMTWEPNPEPIEICVDCIYKSESLLKLISGEKNGED